MKPVAAEVRLLRIPFATPFVTATGVQTHRNATIVALEDEFGNRGWGECVADVTAYTAPETPDTAFASLSAGLSQLLELRADRSRPLVAAAVKAALADLTSNLQRRSLATTYGAEPGPVEVGAVVGRGDTTEVVDEVEKLLDEGYRRVKLKMRGDDWDAAEAARAAFPEAPLSVDANGSLVPGEIDVARIDRLELQFIEQPYGSECLEETADLRARSQTPICLDESVRSTGELADAIAMGAVDMVSIKPGMVGGVDHASAIAQMAHEHGVGAWTGGMLETGIGRGHSLGFARTGWMTAPADLSGSIRYFPLDVVEPWTAADGIIEVPDEAGLGRALNTKALEQFTVSQCRVER